jgi:hypothetical protein
VPGDGEHNSQLISYALITVAFHASHNKLLGLYDKMAVTMRSMPQNGCHVTV